MLILIALAIVCFAIAPLHTALALGIALVAFLVSGYVAIAALTAGAMLPLLLAGSAGVRAPVVATGVAAAVIVLFVHRASIRRLRTGTEPRSSRFGNAPLAPGERSGVGPWAKPEPHGLLGRSALSVGAALTILAAFAISAAVVACCG